MKKRYHPMLCLLILCFWMLCPAVSAEAVDPQAQASLTLHYQQGDTVFGDLQVRIYRIAAVSPDGTYRLVSPFASYPINIHGITTQLQWDQIADTLHSYITAEQVTPNRQAATDEAGIARFPELETGLYYVDAVTAEKEDGTYIFNRFLVYLPTPQADGTHNYHVEAKPKCAQYLPKTEYSVTKLWQDSGYSDSRPGAVTVDIYKDGVFQESQTLNADNNWSYSWKVAAGDTGVWTVAEQAVPENYKVTVRQNGSHFSIVNTRQAQPETPSTGDSFAPLPWILALCLSGMGVLILAILVRRRK